MMSVILRHKHLRRCYMLKTRGPESEPEHILKCKATDNYFQSLSPAQHSFKYFDMPHKSEAVDVLKLIGLVEDDSTSRRLHPKTEALVAKRHMPPTQKDDGLLSPVCGPLVARNPSTSNLQFTTGCLVGRYLAKYIASIPCLSCSSVR